MSKPVKWRDARRERGDNDPKSLQRTAWQSRDYTVQDEGIILDIDERRVSSISLKGFALLVVSFLLFKAAAMVWLGLTEYAAAIKTLQYGTVFDQMAAFIMRPDALSQYLAVQLHGSLS